MFCNNCGKKIPDGSKYCPECGNDLTKYNQYDSYQPINETNYNQRSVSNPDDESSFLFALLSFFIPIVGVILFVIWFKEYPKRAKSCLYGAITGMVLWFIFVCCMSSSIINYTQNHSPFGIHYDLFVR